MQTALHPDHITNLPTDIHFKIFELLRNDPVVSTCLGLTCKTLYRIHRTFHGKVPLTEITAGFTPYAYNDRLLSTHLKDWIPAELVYDNRFTHKFITKERLLELMPEKERMKENARLKRKLEADPQEELDRELERETLRLERESIREGQQLERILEREMQLLEGKFEQGLQRLKMWARKLQQQRHCSKLSKVVEPGLIKPSKGRKLENFR